VDKFDQLRVTDVVDEEILKVGVNSRSTILTFAIGKGIRFNGVERLP